MESSLETLPFSTGLTSNDAIAELGMALGLDDQGVIKRMPELEGFSGVVYFRQLSGQESRIKISGEKINGRIDDTKISGRSSNEIFSYIIDQDGNISKI